MGFETQLKGLLIALTAVALMSSCTSKRFAFRETLSVDKKWQPAPARNESMRARQPLNEVAFADTAHTTIILPNITQHDVEPVESPQIPVQGPSAVEGKGLHEAGVVLTAIGPVFASAAVIASGFNYQRLVSISLLLALFLGGIGLLIAGIVMRTRSGHIPQKREPETEGPKNIRGTLLIVFGFVLWVISLVLVIASFRFTIGPTVDTTTPGERLALGLFALGLIMVMCGTLFRFIDAHNEKAK